MARLRTRHEPTHERRGPHLEGVDDQGLPWNVGDTKEHITREDNLSRASRIQSMLATERDRRFPDQGRTAAFERRAGVCVGVPRKRREVTVALVELQSEIVDELDRSRKIKGELSPIIVDQFGNVLNGRHRKAAGWQSIRVIPVKDDLDRAMVKLQFMVQRRATQAEHIELLTEICIRLEEQGRDPITIADYVAKHFSPFERSYTYALIPNRYKRATGRPRGPSLDRHTPSPAREEKVECFQPLETRSPSVEKVSSPLALPIPVSTSTLHPPTLIAAGAIGGASAVYQVKETKLDDGFMIRPRYWNNGDDSRTSPASYRPSLCPYCLHAVKVTERGIEKVA
jgi:hypothetical protein